MRRVAAMGGLLAAVGGLVTLRSAVSPPASPSLSAAGMAAPVSPAAPARPHRHRSHPTRHAGGSRHSASTRTDAPSTAAAPTHTAAPHTAKPAPVRRRVTGSAFNVGYGVVQVRVTFVGRRMVDVTALSLPQGGRSSDISSYAGPQLRKEALAAQSANIDAVSGASYTSAGYAKSLQSALDRARA
jgi:uncharacterized protein with FMN-binding domain